MFIWSHFLRKTGDHFSGECSSAAGQGTSDMRANRNHSASATNLPRQGGRRLPVLVALATVAGSALAVLALYRLVADHGMSVASLYFHFDMALLTGATIAACGALALMIRRNRIQRDEIERLELRLEDFSDRAWEVKEAEERAKSFLEAQGDVIVR